MPRHTLTLGDNPYPHVTAKMWADGERYVRILCDRYVRRLPPWVDKAGFESAALYALLATARIYNPAKGAWSTPLTISVKHHLDRELTAQMNWHRGAKPTCRTYDGPEVRGPLSLDAPLKDSEERSKSFGESLPDERIGPEELVTERALLRELLSRIQPRQRAVIHAIFYEGKSTRDLAVAMGTTHQTVHNIYRRALNALRREADRAQLSL
jgi:RNA polymerase sigma factor (sigma-70 family)